MYIQFIHIKYITPILLPTGYTESGFVPAIIDWIAGGVFLIFLLPNHSAFPL